MPGTAGDAVAQLPQDLTGVPIIVTTSKGQSWEARITEVVRRGRRDRPSCATPGNRNLPTTVRRPPQTRRPQHREYRHLMPDESPPVRQWIGGRLAAPCVVHDRAEPYRPDHNLAHEVRAAVTETIPVAVAPHPPNASPPPVPARRHSDYPVAASTER